MFIITFNPFNLEGGPPYRGGGDSGEEGREFSERRSGSVPSAPPGRVSVGQGAQCSILPLLADSRFHLLL